MIIANKEENHREQIENLAEVATVYVSDIKSPQDALAMISDVGQLVEREGEASKLIGQIEEEMDGFKSPKIQATSLYFIWKDPYMVVSNDTFIQSMIGLTGLRNALSQGDARYPEVKLDEIAQVNPDVIFLSSEPYAFTTGDLHDMATHFPNSLIKLIDGEMMSWYGSRLIKGLRYLMAIQKEIGLTLEGRKSRK